MQNDLTAGTCVVSGQTYEVDQSINAHRLHQAVECHGFHLSLSSAILSGKWAAVRLLLFLRRLRRSSHLAAYNKKSVVSTFP